VRWHTNSHGRHTMWWETRWHLIHRNSLLKNWLERWTRNGVGRTTKSDWQPFHPLFLSFFTAYAVNH
jgi:hypothetical protein